MSTEKINTGLADLDNILNNEESLAIEPMPIDKKMFDNVILPLLRNEVNITSDESFAHLRNIWTNYYSNYSKNRVLMYKDNQGIAAKPMTGNAVFTPMAIKDITGAIVAVTPPLIEPMLVVGMNEVLEGYSNEMKHNPNLAKTKLVNSMKQYTISSNQNWVDFLTTYNDGITDAVVDDDNDDLMIRS